MINKKIARTLAELLVPNSRVEGLKNPMVIHTTSAAAFNLCAELGAPAMINARGVLTVALLRAGRQFFEAGFLLYAGKMSLPPTLLALRRGMVQTIRAAEFMCE